MWNTDTITELPLCTHEKLKVVYCGSLHPSLHEKKQTGDVLYLEHEIGGHWYVLRSGKVSFYVSLRPLETDSEVVRMRTLERDGYFGHVALLLNVLSRSVDVSSDGEMR